MKPTKKPIIYIAGKMTGLPDLGQEKFNAAEKNLRELGYFASLCWNKRTGFTC